METHKRRQAILALLRDTGEVQIDDLARRFGVSGNSIRNDLDTLAEQGELTRVRGGALAPPAGILPPHSSTVSRLHANKYEKEAMGRWAAEMVRDGDAIVMDDSSSVFQMATFLRVRRNLTVVTNGLEVALLLAQEPTNKVILAANTVSPGEASLVGNLNPDLLQSFRASRCFLSCAGFSEEQGLTDTDGDKATLKSQMLRLAAQRIALVDHSKFGLVSTFRTAGLSEIDHLVTDQRVPGARLAELRRACTFPITVAGGAEAQTLSPIGTVPERRFRIAFGNLSERMVFAQQVRESLENAARSMSNVELLACDNALDRQTALANADWFVAQGVDLVIEYQIDAEAGNVIMDKFQRAAIPVIAVDIPMPGATFFGADNYRAGRMAGEALGHWVRTNWGEVDRVVELDCRRAGSVGAARLQGQREGLAAVIGPIAEDRVQEVDCPVIMEDVPTLATALVSAIPAGDRVAIIAINDDAALGVLAAFERASRLGQVVAVGQNSDLLGRAALRRSDFPFIGSTAYSPESYGERLLDLALKILRGEPVPPAVFVPHVFITKENIEQFYPGGAEAAPDPATFGGQAAPANGRPEVAR